MIWQNGAAWQNQVLSVWTTTAPDFTRGYWNTQKGYRHAYASPADEAAAEALAKASTEAQKELTAKKKLWEKYDKDKAKAKAKAKK